MNLTVWRIELNNSDLATKLWSLLNDSEQHRAARFRSQELQRRYIIAHGALRLILADVCQCSLKNLEFVYNQWGKPALANSNSPVFNLSHAQDLALLAIAANGELGIDVEMLRLSPIIERRDLVKRFFNLTEYHVLNQLNDQAFIAAFFRCWTLKEAYIKAKGLGLSLPLNRFSIECHPESKPILISSEDYPEDVANYHFWELNVPQGYWGSLAYYGSNNHEIVYHDWTLTQNKLFF